VAIRARDLEGDATARPSGCWPADPRGGAIPASSMPRAVVAATSREPALPNSAPIRTLSKTLRSRNGRAIWKARAMPSSAMRLVAIAGDRPAVELDRAGTRRQIAGHQVEQRRFAGAVGADDAGDRTGLDRERNVGHRRRPRKFFDSPSTRRIGAALIARAPRRGRRRAAARCGPGPARRPAPRAREITSSRPVANRWKSSSRPRITWVMNTSMKAPITGPNSVPMPPSRE